MNKDSVEYTKEVKIRTYRVLKPFMHFKKDDEVDLVLRLTYTIDGSSWNETYHSVQAQLVGVYDNTILPPKALLDEGFFENVWSPYKLLDFMKECSVAKPDNVAASVNYKIDNDNFGLDNAKYFLVELWFNQIKTDHLVAEFNK